MLKTLEIVALTDNLLDDGINDTSNYDETAWPGCLYYDLFQREINDTVYYFLLGADFNDPLSNKKIIEVLHFDKEGKPRFGAPLFNKDGQVYQRIIFEYAEQAVMTLRYDNDTGMIIFDHLSPSRPQYKGNYQFYGPDFSFDGFRFEKNRWVFQSDLDVRNR
jgi:hypothetical protein